MKNGTNGHRVTLGVRQVFGKAKGRAKPVTKRWQVILGQAGREPWRIFGGRDGFEAVDRAAAKLTMEHVVPLRFLPDCALIEVKT